MTTVKDDLGDEAEDLLEEAEGVRIESERKKTKYGGDLPEGHRDADD